MNKHTLAILFGFAGLLTAGLMYPGHGSKTAYIAIGVGIGVFLGYLIQGTLTTLANSGSGLVMKFKRFGTIRGRHVADLMDAIGDPTEVIPVRLTDRNNALGSYYVWKEGGYEVKVLVDENEVCVGVSGEVLNGKVLQG